nr:hypothetical protein [Luteimonas terrae]
MNHSTCEAKSTLSPIMRLTKRASPPGHHSSPAWPPKLCRAEAGAARREIAALAPVARRGFARRCMEGRIAQRHVETLAGVHDAAEQLPCDVLTTQLDRLLQRVRAHNGIGDCERLRIDVRGRESPAVLGVAQQGIDEVRARAHIEGTHARATRDLAVAIVGEQVGEAVDVIGAAGDRRAQIAVRQVPVRNPVIGLQQRLVERAHGARVCEIDARLAGGRAQQEGLERLRRTRQAREFVAALMAVAGMKTWRGGGHGMHKRAGKSGFGLEQKSKWAPAFAGATLPGLSAYLCTFRPAIQRSS